MTDAAVVGAVVGAGLLHAAWNALAHGIPDRRTTLFLLTFGSAPVGLVLALLCRTPAGGAWPFLVASAALHVLYALLLLRSYDLGDFSQMYPVARGTGPLVVSAVAIVVVGETLGALQVAGLLVLTVGLVVIAAPGKAVRAGGAALLAAVATGVSIAGYTVLDGLGVRRGHSPAGYAGWLFMLQLGFLPIVLLLPRRSGARVRPDVRTVRLGLAAGALSVAAYGIVIWAQTRLDLSRVAATREVSIVFGAVIGRFLFREPLGRRRIVGSVVAVAGIAVLNV